ncbi:AMP-binding protein [Ideonella livida]|uniref:AMP-binding protein n=1 Tax=Ideonella livida TaxID=2707176 RepID=A0A7C9TLU3_9BURK|nr:AMP-binding protein [Ideonella livida]NDY91827.1 AMP-binding protein [Ideonella livida]
MPLHEQLIQACLDHPGALMLEVQGLGGAPARACTYAQVHAAAEQLTALLPAQAVSPRVGLVMANGPEWVVADLALLIAGAVEVPVPLAFSAEQAHHLLAPVDLCLVDRAGQARLNAWLASPAWAGRRPPAVLNVDLDELLSRDTVRARRRWTREDDVCKVIHTSGTTSLPKGVRIRSQGLSDLLVSLRRRAPARAYARSFSLVPLSLLIEQVTAVYLTLLDGGTLVFPPDSIPLLGELGGTPVALLPCLRQARPSALTLPPSMVEALLAAAQTHILEDTVQRSERLFGRARPPFMACGGAPVASQTLAQLAALGLTLHEGYGLSENSSVVAWNAPGHFKAGTVGQALDHVQVRLSPAGELLVRSSSLFAGYDGGDPSSCGVDAEGWLHTGDLAEIDAEGFITVKGRLKNVFITAHGRNVAPEWVESRYRTLACVEQAVLFGEGLPAVCGFFVVAPGWTLEAAQVAIERFGQEHLSEVERAQRLVLVPAGPQVQREGFTVTGRPRRDQIWAQYLAPLAGATGAPKGTAEDRAAPAMRGAPQPALQSAAPWATDLPAQVSPLSAQAGHAGSRGLLLLAPPGSSVQALAPAPLLSRLAQAGFVLLRGYGPTMDDFSDLVRRLSRRITLDPARSFGGQGGVAQKVDAGLDAVGLHCENGNSPFMPDLCWFYCEQGPRTGSQTTVCDGQRVWAALSAPARQAFLQQDIVYSRRVEEDKWKRFAFHMLGGAKPLAHITVDDLVAQAGDPQRTRISLEADGAIQYRFQVGAVHTTLFGDGLAFANSLLGPSYHYERPRITFADGRALPADLLAEVQQVTEALTENIDWQTGDVVLIDNTRVMHGRRAIDDPSRRIFNALSYL